MDVVDPEPSESETEIKSKTDPEPDLDFDQEGESDPEIETKSKPKFKRKPGPDPENPDVKKRYHCRKVAGQRRNEPNRHTYQDTTSSSPLSSTTILMGLATMSCMMSPIAAASLNNFTPARHMGFITRRDRRAAGERNIKLGKPKKDNKRPVHK